MSKAIREHNGEAMVTMVLLAALLVLVGLVFVVRQSATTVDRSGTPAISAERARGSSLTRDPYVDRHAAIVAHYRADTPAMSKEGGGGSSLTRDPAIERHAEIVALYKPDTPR